MQSVILFNRALPCLSWKGGIKSKNKIKIKIKGPFLFPLIGKEKNKIKIGSCGSCYLDNVLVVLKRQGWFVFLEHSVHLINLTVLFRFIVLWNLFFSPLRAV